MPERAPPGVLPGQADVPALEQQGAVGQRLAQGPVGLAAGPQLGPVLEDPHQLGVDGEALREGARGRRRPAGARRAATPVSIGGSTGAGCGRRGQDGRSRRRRGPGLVQGGLQPLREVSQDLLGLGDGDVAPPDQRLGVELADAAVFLDQLVEQRLGEAGIVLLVVAVAPVADQVDDDVLVERLAEGEGQPAHPDAGLGIVAVDVEDRGLDHLGHVGGVDRRPGRVRVGGEAQLVVDDQVHGAAGLVAGQGRHVEGLGHHALAGERRVPVDEQRAGRDGH